MISTIKLMFQHFFLNQQAVFFVTHGFLEVRDENGVLIQKVEEVKKNINIFIIYIYIYINCLNAKLK